MTFAAQIVSVHFVFTAFLFRSHTSEPMNSWNLINEAYNESNSRTKNLRANPLYRSSVVENAQIVSGLYELKRIANGILSLNFNNILSLDNIQKKI